MDVVSATPRPLPGAVRQGLVVLVTAAMLFALYGPGYLGVDAMWSIVWGRDLTHLSALTESGTTTPHVLSNVLGAVITPFGSDSDRALVVLSFVGAAGLVWVVALTAREIAGTSAGVVAGLLMASREQLLFATRSGFLDVFSAALVAWAVLWLVRHRGERVRGAAVLLVLAGLLRPEPWVLLAVLVAVRWWRVRRLEPGLVVAVVLVPLLWALADLVLSGDALYSLHQTRRVSDLFRAGQGIPTGLRERLVSVPRNLGHAPGPELLLLAMPCAAAIFWPGGRGARLRLRAFGDVGDARVVEQLRIATFAGVVLAAVVSAEAVTGTLLFSRFLLPFAGIVAAVVAASLVLVARAHLGARAPAGVAASAAVLLLIAAPFLVHARQTTDPEHARYEAARAVLRPGVPCGPVVVPGVNFQAFAAVWTGVRGSSVKPAAESGVSPSGSYVDAVGAEPQRLLLDPSFPQERVGDRGAVLVRSDAGWTVRATCVR